MNFSHHSSILAMLQLLHSVLIEDWIGVTILPYSSFVYAIRIVWILHVQ